MATQATTAERTEAIDEETEVEVRPRKGGLSGKKLVLFIVLPLVLLLAGGGAAAYLTGFLGGEATAPDEAELVNAGPTVFYDLPDMLVNLNSTGRKPGYLKIRVSLELGDAEAVHHVETVLPRIIDSFQVYLRELRIEDLRGSAGLYRLREELLLRVNETAAPVEVKDVLFKEMLVQ